MSYDGLSRYLRFENLQDPGSRFTLEKVLATGTYGEVHEATDGETGRKVAIKMVENIKDTVEELEEEYRVLHELSGHENFPEFYGVFIKRLGRPDEHQVWFVMELMAMGSVTELVKGIKEKGERMKEPVIAYILREIIKACMELHSKHIMHRDIKGLNILITEQGKVKLVDFGQCSHLKSTLARKSTAVGTPYWMAPEVIECEQKPNNEYDIRCDVWALGITALELAEGEPPYADIHPVRALFQIVRNPPPSVTRISDWSQDFVDFLSECLVKNPEHRPIMMELLEHPFLSLVPEEPAEIQQELLTEVNRVRGLPLVKPKHAEAIARQGYLKTDRRDKPKKMFTDDLVSLENFNEEIILENLYARWQEGYIYTWIADVLLVINPYSDKANYNEEIQVKYKSKSRSENDPHVFAVCDKAHQDMMHHKEHQTIILSGESGSGKTFNFNQIVNQLCFIGCSNPGLIDKIKKTTVILDAMGNAVTILNHDATRHCRYFDITFSKTGKVSGAIVAVTMLDKYRVTTRPRDEGNFHMFYYLYDGLSQSSRLARYGLKLGRKYRLLARHSYDNEVTNAQRFNKVEEAFIEVGFTDRQLHTVYLILAAVLNVGNIEFKGGEKAAIVDMEPVKEVCRLLDVEEKKFSWALCNYCQMKPGGDVEPRTKTEEEAMAGRDALARTLYVRCFDYVVNTININLAVTRLVFGDPFAIGILDMFGFEANDHNTLENLFVNVANEQIQYFYNQCIFNWEMQDYEAEGIPIRNFAFPDNRHILEMFLGKGTGFFSLLEEEARNPDGGDRSFSQKLKSRANQKQVQHVADQTFAVAHYVGRVKYDCNTFVEKNRDTLSTELIQTFRKSANDDLRSLFLNPLTKTGNVTTDTFDKKKKSNTGAKTEKKGSRHFNTRSKGRLSQTRHIQTLGLTFRYSLIELLFKLTNSSPHFVRCIRSNMDNSPSSFDRDMIKHQVKYHAVCDTIRIRQQGFAHRIAYDEFLRRYQFLAFDFDETVDITKDNARLLLVRLKMEGWAIGKNKVFLKFYNEEYLSRLYEMSVKKIVKIQAMMRAYMMRKRRREGKLGPNAAAASKSASRPARSMTQDEAATKIQSNFRGYKARKENPEIADNITQRKKFGEATVEGEAARYVQYYFRKWKMRTIFQTLQTYRADRQQQLVYFSQQVHLYSQELQAKMQRLNHDLDLGKVRNEAHGAHKTILARAPSAMPKLALDHTLNAYFDTSFLCDPTRSRKGRGCDDDWEAPFKSKQSAAAMARANNMGLAVGSEDKRDQAPSSGFGYNQNLGVKSRTAMFNQGGNEYNNNYTSSSNNAGYNRPAGSSNPPRNQGYNRFAGSNMNRASPTTPVYNKYGGSYLQNAKPVAPKPPVVVNSWNDRGHDGYSNNNYDGGDTGGTHDFRKHLRRTNIHAEMEARARNTDSSASGDSPFNFQGMLRKTNVNRESLRRTPSPSGAYYEPPRSYNDTSRSYNDTSRSYNDTPGSSYSEQRVDTPTFTEETEEAML